MDGIPRMQQYLIAHKVAICRNTDPLLPAVVKGLGLVHAIPVAKVASVPVVTKVAVLVAKVATVTTSLLKL